MPPQSRTTQGFAGAAVEIDLIRKGIMTWCCAAAASWSSTACGGNRPDSQRDYDSTYTDSVQDSGPLVEIDLIRKGIMTGLN